MAQGEWEEKEASQIHHLVKDTVLLPLERPMASVRYWVVGLQKITTDGLNLGRLPYLDLDHRYWFCGVQQSKISNWRHGSLKWRKDRVLFYALLICQLYQYFGVIEVVSLLIVWSLYPWLSLHLKKLKQFKTVVTKYGAILSVFSKRGLLFSADETFTLFSVQENYIWRIGTFKGSDCLIAGA